MSSVIQQHSCGVCKAALLVSASHTTQAIERRMTLEGGKEVTVNVFELNNIASCGHCSTEEGSSVGYFHWTCMTKVFEKQYNEQTRVECLQCQTVFQYSKNEEQDPELSATIEKVPSPSDNKEEPVSQQASPATSDPSDNSSSSSSSSSESSDDSSSESDDDESTGSSSGSSLPASPYAYPQTSPIRAPSESSPPPSSPVSEPVSNPSSPTQEQKEPVNLIEHMKTGFAENPDNIPEGAKEKAKALKDAHQDLHDDAGFDAFTNEKVLALILGLDAKYGLADFILEMVPSRVVTAETNQLPTTLEELATANKKTLDPHTQTEKPAYILDNLDLHTLLQGCEREEAKRIMVLRFAAFTLVKLNTTVLEHLES